MATKERIDVSQQMAERSAKVFTTALDWETPLAIKSTSGVYLTDYSGRKYLDFTSGVGVANIGYNHPAVMKAATAQIKDMIHHGTIFRTESVVRLAEKLAEITPQSIRKFFFSNSGAEAVEGALKLARYASKKQDIIAFRGGFHGRTFGAMSITTSKAKYSTAYGPKLPGVHIAPFPYLYRHPFAKTPEECSAYCLDDVMNILKHETSAEGVAAMIVEPVQGEGGYVVPPKEFLRGLREICDKHGILLIFDEVQSGMGRTCKWWASQHFNVEPDIMTIAKGIASGFPLSAVGGRDDIMSGWEANMHGTTFGGNPVSCAAALATIGTIEKDGLLEKGQKGASHIMDRLAEMKANYPIIGDVRGLGLMIGVEFIKKEAPEKKLINKEGRDAILKDCLDNGLVLLACGTNGNIIRIVPPLTVTVAQVDKGLDIFEAAIKKNC